MGCRMEKDEKLKRLAAVMQSLGGKIQKASELPPPIKKTLSLPSDDVPQPHGAPNFRTYFPDARALTQTSPRAWLLRTVYSQDGTPDSFGVRLPTEQADFCHCNL
jgi:hypothetical protein